MRKCSQAGHCATVEPLELLSRFADARLSTLNTNVLDRPSIYINSSTISISSSLTSISVNITFTNISFVLFDCGVLSYQLESKESNNIKYENIEFEQIARETNKDQSTSVSIISNNIKRQNISLDQVVTQVKKIINLIERKKQIEIIYAIECLQEFLILIAKISFGKNLIFNILFLFYLFETNIVLIVVLLKLISEQQVKQIKNYYCKRLFVYNIDNRFKHNRQQIATKYYTYSS